jgi:6-phospho-beta-glucosidase
VVGGGSQFAIGLCESLVDYGRDWLKGTTVVLLDVKEEQLQAVNRFATRLAESAGVDMKFEATTDRRRAFDGADFILTTFRPGSHAQQLEDETVPPKYGLQGNETVGLGGIFMACRVVPVLREMCADAEELCPNAWMVNYTNPTQFVADAVQRVSKMRIISLCDGYVDICDDLASLLDVDPADVNVYVMGTNHAVWVKRFTVKGEDGYPLLEKRLKELSWEEIEARYAPPKIADVLGVKYPYEIMYKQFIQHNTLPFALRLYQVHGMFPGPRYYWNYWMNQDHIVELQKAGKYVSMAGFYIEHMQPALFERLEARLREPSPQLQTSRAPGGGGHGDMAVRLIAAMVNNLSETFIVNVTNHGAISNLPDDAIVEVPAVVDAQGAHPYAMGPLPKDVLGMQQALVYSQQLSVDAALSGSRADLLKALTSHPLIHSLDGAEKAMDELLSLQAEWLPQFRR